MSRERPVLVLPEFSLQKTHELTACLDLLPREVSDPLLFWFFYMQYSVRSRSVFDRLKVFFVGSDPVSSLSFL